MTGGDAEDCSLPGRPAIMGRFFLLSREDWFGLFVSREMRLLLFGNLLIRLVMVILNLTWTWPALVPLRYDIVAHMSFLYMLLITSILCRARPHVTVPIIGLIANFAYIAGSLAIALLAPERAEIATMVVPISFLGFNNLILSRWFSLLLDALVGLAVVATAIALLRNGHRVDVEDVINLMLIALSVGLGQYIAQNVREHMQHQLDAAHRAVNEMDASHRLVAENIRIREELARMNRITAVEAMTTSISHEMNQPIGSALTFVEATRRWLERDPPDLPEALRAIDGAVVQIGRAGDIITAIRRMTVRSPGQFERVDLAELTSSLLNLLASDLNEGDIDHKLVVLPGAEGVTVLARSEEISQVVVNLVSNSVDALAMRAAGRRIDIEIGRDPGGWVHLAVRDNGCGIGSADLPHVLESFYTTKDKGTGLGLSICRDIAESHGGSLQVSSAGDGTEVTLLLPVSEPDFRLSDSSSLSE